MSRVKPDGDWNNAEQKENSRRNLRAHKKDRDNFATWSCAYPPLEFRIVPNPLEPHEPRFAPSGANTWDMFEAARWASNNCFHETANVLLDHRIDGRKLIRLDAVGLQNLGVSDGIEALQAQEKIRQVANCVDKSFPKAYNPATMTMMNRALYYNIQPCPGYNPLYMLTTDPWVDHSVRMVDVRDWGREKWFWTGCSCEEHNNPVTCSRFKYRTNFD
ncbi:uncharacterized protein LOC131942613 [Physella acuta]|uniref:uncharacterized protein LOC131942613 n=1 Tax=Physella acuta TaxID=109671 RepID=UPI0027DC12BF|nr:uncharacterized protein LOC131942613 [Physella acuta]